MAKKKKIVEEHKSEPVTNSCSGKRPIGPSGDQSLEPVANSNQLVKVDANSNQQLAVTNFDRKNINIESFIRTIRGQKVMVDFDLAMLYGVQNKRLNEQVKRNIKRFPDDFMFQLTKEEWNILKSQIATAKQSDNQSNGILKSQNATSSWGGSLIR